MTGRLCCVLYLLAAGCAQAQTNLATINEDMLAANIKLDGVCSRQKEDAVVSYGKDLDGLMAALQQKGDLDGVMAVRAEKKRFAAEKSVDESNSQDANVIAAVKKYRAAVSMAERERVGRRVVLLRQATAQIDALIKQLVKQGKIEDALAAKKDMQTMRSVLAEEESKLPPPKVAATTAANPPSDTAAKPKVGAAKPKAEAASKKTAFGNHYYQRIDQNLSWHDAKEACKNMGGQLVVITSAKENSFVAKVADGHEVWIGCSDDVEEGEWRWVDNTPLTFKGWDPGPPEPNGATEGEDYVAFRGGLWNDAGDYHRPFICEWSY
jgi:hypothetical protein